MRALHDEMLLSSHPEAILRSAEKEAQRVRLKFLEAKKIFFDREKGGVDSTRARREAHPRDGTTFLKEYPNSLVFAPKKARKA